MSSQHTAATPGVTWPPAPLAYRYPEGYADEGGEVVALDTADQAPEEGWSWGGAVTADEVNDLRELVEMAYRVVALNQRTEEGEELRRRLQERFETVGAVR